MVPLGDAKPDLILQNARVLTQDARIPNAQALAVRGDRIVWVGSDAESRQFAVLSPRVIDCDGGTLIPGFHDAHMHLLAYASTFGAVDCGPGQASSIADIVGQIAKQAERTPQGQWISAWGYDPFHLPENRHPTRWDLDRAAPDHPVRLDHRSGHACVLNSTAMDRVGIREDTDEPPGATIARDLATGSPNGLLLEMQDFLDQRIPNPPVAELTQLVRKAALRLLSFGVTSIQDATHTNSLDRWSLFHDLAVHVRPLPGITMMPGAGHVAEFGNTGLQFGSGSDLLRLGHAKVMVTESTGAPTPSPEDLKSAVEDCTSYGLPVAVHAVEAEVVRTVAELLTESQVLSGQGLSHRIEHCSESPPDVLEAVVECGAAVVTQPGFIHHQGDRYLAEVSPTMRPYLYRTASLAARGVKLAFSSDAPVSDPDPMPALHAALTRRTAAGGVIGVDERLDFEAALRAYTLEPARLIGMDDRIGRLSPGYRADMALLAVDLTALEPDALLGLRPAMTILGGQVVWES